MGRKKIRIAPIMDEQVRQNTFSKRKAGVFKKAMELSILCGCEVALLVFSPADRLFTFSTNGLSHFMSKYNAYVGPYHELTNADYAVEFSVGDHANTAAAAASTTAAVPVTVRTAEELSCERVSPLPAQRQRVDAEGNSTGKQDQSANTFVRKCPPTRTPFTTPVVPLQHVTPISLDLLAKPICTTVSPSQPLLSAGRSGSFKRLGHADHITPQQQQQLMIQLLIQQHQQMMCQNPIVLSSKNPGSSLNSLLSAVVVSGSSNTSPTSNTCAFSFPAVLDSPSSSVTNSEQSVVSEKSASAMDADTKSEKPKTEEESPSIERSQSASTG